jgi:hypothetical protein
MPLQEKSKYRLSAANRSPRAYNKTTYSRMFRLPGADDSRRKQRARSQSWSFQITFRELNKTAPAQAFGKKNSGNLRTKLKTAQAA